MVKIEIEEDTLKQLEEFQTYCRKIWFKNGSYSFDTIISTALDRELNRLKELRGE